jgi:hypothetical protein
MESVRQSVWIAESLIDQYASVMTRYLAAWKDDNEPEMAVLRGEIERVYPSIWEHLDAAGLRTRDLGRDAGAYFAIRQTPGLEIGAAIANVTEKVVGVTPGLRGTTVTSQINVHHNAEGVELARQAAAALRTAWPEADWTPPSEPEVDLRPRGLLARLFRRK